MKYLTLVSLVACAADPQTQTQTQSSTITQKAAASLTGAETKTRVVSDVTTPIEVKLDDTTVICSQADYSAKLLKVIIPQIAALTVFDHRNQGAGGPCIAAGMCTTMHGPSNIIDASNPTATIDMHVVLIANYDVDHDNKTCSVSLTENLDTNIRGIVFKHQRYGEISTRNYEDCLGL